MAGRIENLKGKGFDSRTIEERRELARKAGLASGEARRRLKAMKSTVRSLLAMSAPKALADKMALLGIDRDDATYQMGIVVGVLQRALNGNVNAARYLIELSGEDPALVIAGAELKLKQDELKLKQQDTDGGGIASELLVKVLQEAWGEKGKKGKKKVTPKRKKKDEGVKK